LQDPWQLLGRVRDDDTVFYDNTPIDDLESFYRAAAVSPQLASSPIYSNRAFVMPHFYHPSPLVPLGPDSLICKPQSQSVRIIWRDNSEIEDSFIVQKRELGLSPVEQYRNLTILPANTIEYTDNQVTSEVSYYYRVRAFNGYGRSRWCGPFKVFIPTPPPPPPDTTCGIFICIDSSRNRLRDDFKIQGTIWLWSEHSGHPHILDRYDFVCANSSVSAPDVFSMNGRGECFEEVRLSTNVVGDEVILNMQVRSLPVENQQLFHNLSVGADFSKADEWRDQFILNGDGRSGYRWAAHPEGEPFPIMFKRWYGILIRIDLAKRTFSLNVENRLMSEEVSFEDLLVIPCRLTQ